jgi:transcriptional regulator with XRE-family HTH domain
MHKGQVLEKAIRNSGYTLTEVAKRAKISRRHLYNIFQMKSPDPDMIQLIGKIIHVDVSALVQYQKKQTLSSSAENAVTYGIDKQDTAMEYWKNKYIALLEEYTALLKKVEKSKKSF